MADINVERKHGLPWLWIILGLILLALLIWWLIPGEEEEAAVLPPPVPEQGIVPADPPPPVPVAQGPLNTIASVLGNPSGVIGQTFRPAAPLRVTEVVSDRGFWVEDQGQRLFVIINEGAPGAPQGQADVQGAQAEMPDVDAGDMVRITEGVVQDPTFLQNLRGPIEPETRRTANGLTVYLVTDGRNIQEVSAGV